jgi:hypothetical protein
MPTFALVDESPTEQTRIVVIQDPTEKCPWHNRPVNRVDYNRIKKQIEAGKKRGLRGRRKAQIANSNRPRPK